MMYYTLFVLLFIIMSIFWASMLLHLMAKDDHKFVGKNDKILWFIVIFFGSALGAFVYCFWIFANGVSKPKVESKPTTFKSVKALARSDKLDFCYHCGAVLQNSPSKCPECQKEL